MLGGRGQRRAKGRNARQDGQCKMGGGKAEPPRGQGSPHLGKTGDSLPLLKGIASGSLRGELTRDTWAGRRPSGSPEARGGLRAMGPAREGKGTYLVTAWHVTARRRPCRGAGSAGVASPVRSERLRVVAGSPGWATRSRPEPRALEVPPPVQMPSTEENHLEGDEN